MAEPKFAWAPEYLAKLENELIEAGQRHVCLSPVSFRMVTDASRMFLWPSRFGLKPGDDVPEQARLAYEGINSPMCFDELVDAVLQLKSVLEAMNNVASTNVQCCDNLPAPTPDPGIVVDSGDPPPTYGGDPITTWDEYKSRLCGASLAWVDSMVVALSKLDDAVSENLLIVGGIGVLLSLLASPAVGLLVAMEYGLAVGLFSSLVGLATGQLVQDAKDYLVANRQDVADVVFCAGSAEQAATDLRAYLSANLPTGAYDTVIRWFSIENNMNVVYSGTDADGNEVTVPGATSCGCYGEPTGLAFFNIGGTILDSNGDPMVSQVSEIITGEQYLGIADGAGSLRTFITSIGPIGTLDAAQVDIEILSIADFNARPTGAGGQYGCKFATWIAPGGGPDYCEPHDDINDIDRYINPNIYAFRVAGEEPPYPAITFRITAVV